MILFQKTFLCTLNILIQSYLLLLSPDPVRENDSVSWESLWLNFSLVLLRNTKKNKATLCE